MNPIRHIRLCVFEAIQADFAEFAGVTQATVSRWETGEFEPNRDDLERIREAAIKQGRPWEDRWFFEVPEQAGS